MRRTLTAPSLVEEVAEAIELVDEHSSEHFARAAIAVILRRLGEGPSHAMLDVASYEHTHLANWRAMLAAFRKENGL